MDPECWERLTVLHTHVESEVSRLLQRRHGLGLSEYRALCRLAAAPDGELRMQDLAVRIGLNQSSVSRLAARLEGAGLTRRVHCDGDRRGVYIVITDAGRKRRAAAEATYTSGLTRALDAAADADAAMAPLIAALSG